MESADFTRANARGLEMRGRSKKGGRHHLRPPQG